MRIIVWGINYAPELTGIAPYNKALCDYLNTFREDDGEHVVEMVTAFPYYPAWKKEPGDVGQFFRTDIVDGVPVHRCWHYVPSRLNSWRRILHEGSFVATSFLRICFLKRPDIFIGISPPLLLGAAAWLASCLKRAPFIFHVQDLQPDAAVGLGMVKQGWFSRLLYGLEAFAYHKAERVSGISDGMLEMFRKKSVPTRKVIHFPNGVTLPDPAEQPPAGGFRARYGISADTFLYVYSGNLGVKQGLDTLVAAALILQTRTNGTDAAPPPKIVICGDGARREALAQMVRDYELWNVLFLPLQPDREYLEMLADMDCCLLPQQQGTGSFFFPSKLLQALSLAKPVLAIADEDSALIREALHPGDFGVCVPPGEPALLADAMEKLPLDPARLRVMGAAGRSFVEKFGITNVIADFVEEIGEVVGEGAPRASGPAPAPPEPWRKESRAA